MPPELLGENTEYPESDIDEHEVDLPASPDTGQTKIGWGEVDGDLIPGPPRPRAESRNARNARWTRFPAKSHDIYVAKGLVNDTAHNPSPPLLPTLARSTIQPCQR